MLCAIEIFALENLVFYEAAKCYQDYAVRMPRKPDLDNSMWGPTFCEDERDFLRLPFRSLVCFMGIEIFALENAWSFARRSSATRNTQCACRTSLTSIAVCGSR